MADRKTATNNDSGRAEKSAPGRGTGAGSRVWEGEGAGELLWLGNAAGKALALGPLMLGGNQERREVLVFQEAGGKCRPKRLEVRKALLCLHQMCLP